MIHALVVVLLLFLAAAGATIVIAIWGAGLPIIPYRRQPPRS